MTMTSMNHRLSSGNRTKYDPGQRVQRSDLDTCDKVLLEVARANKRGVKITIWDLPEITGIPLHHSFAAVRSLEFGRLIAVGDDLSDPFGATLELREAGSDRLRQRRVA
ncbi:hypothetical protein N6L26_04100 [Qipengyuania sp. SS22]|uniref:hypothetical protein n=1 Tax=Qipengyuania sp. SS22 TaxID=2979461 RepID=UPI0021E5E575|nr:hypothetical protein [Qipengyuania sp. SS22]UYH55748.1 hypothetical protein N6L26_04100 [Qipengyuania sp. SS22]